MTGLFYDQLQFLYPLPDNFSQRCCIAPAYGKPLQNRRFRTEFADIRFGMPHTTAFARLKRHDCLIQKIIRCQGSCKGRRNCRPTVGRTDKNYVIGYPYLFRTISLCPSIKTGTENNMHNCATILKLFISLPSRLNLYCKYRRRKANRL